MTSTAFREVKGMMTSLVLIMQMECLANAGDATTGHFQQQSSNGDATSTVFKEAEGMMMSFLC